MFVIILPLKKPVGGFNGMGIERKELLSKWMSGLWNSIVAFKLNNVLIINQKDNKYLISFFYLSDWPSHQQGTIIKVRPFSWILVLFVHLYQSQVIVIVLKRIKKILSRFWIFVVGLW